MVVYATVRVLLGYGYVTVAYRPVGRCFSLFCFVLFSGVSTFCLCYIVVIRFKGKENKMNTVVSFDWWHKSITVAFTDYNTAHCFSIGNVVTVKGVKARMRRELRRETGVELSNLKYWRTDGSVDYYRANRKGE